MKKILSGILVLLIMNSLFMSCKSGHVSPGNPLVYMIMIGSNEEEKSANVLIESIKRFGGEYANAPVIIVTSDSSATRGKSLKGKVKQIVKLKMNEKLRRFPFSDKVYACAQVEEMVKDSTNWLLWLNPDALVVASPVEIIGESNSIASLRHVHIQNIGSPFNEPVSEYWKKIYSATGIDTTGLWSIESYVDSKILRPYYNSGCMAFRPQSGILSEWKKAYESMLLDEKIYAFYASDNNGAFFFHQALLSALITSKAGKERINILPDSYGYPLQLQNRNDFTRKKHDLSETKIVLSGGYDNLKGFIISEPYKSWLKDNLVY